MFLLTKYNDFNPENDYLFMLDMFNKKNDPTEKQQNKIKAIIMNSIRPYLVEQLKDKVISEKV